MSTTAPLAVTPTHAAHQADITIYGHSALLYCWPAWAVAFVMALWTYLDNYHAVLVPGDRDAAAVALEEAAANPDSYRGVYLAHSPLPGALFLITLLVVLVFSNASLRGPWSLVFAVSIVALVLLFSWMGWWGPVFRWYLSLRVHINMGGYVAFAVPLCLIWAVTIFFLDRRTYLVSTAGQLRFCDHLGAVEKVFDAWSVTFEKRPYNWFHRLVGWGAGDLMIRAGSGVNRETFEMRNVVRVAHWLRLIEERLKTRDVE